MPDERNYKLILRIAIVLTVVIVALALFYVTDKVSIFAILLGTFLGIIVAHFLNMTFTIADAPLELDEGEELILETADSRTYIHVPNEVGEFDGAGPPLRANLFLTNKRIIADPEDYDDFIEEGSPYFYFINNEDIVRLTHEKKGKSDYIRITFTNPQLEEKDVLLFTSTDTQKWVQELQSIIS